jgi:hypothetical protein
MPQFSTYLPSVIALGTCFAAAVILALARPYLRADVRRSPRFVTVIGFTISPMVNFLLNEEGHESLKGIEQMTGRPRSISQICDEFSVAIRYTLTLAEEARTLIRTLEI